MTLAGTRSRAQSTLHTSWQAPHGLYARILMLKTSQPLTLARHDHPAQGCLLDEAVMMALLLVHSSAYVTALVVPLSFWLEGVTDLIDVLRLLWWMVNPCSRPKILI
jgi:hypothetical protein